MPRPKNKPQPSPLTEREMVDILEDIARNGSNAAARIAAIKTLRELRLGQQTPDEAFEALDELAPRRNYKTKTA